MEGPIDEDAFKNLKEGEYMAEMNEVSKGLSKVLAETYTLYLKTQNYHWNVTGPWFDTLHRMFETQYTQFPPAIDILAERIRALGFKSPGSYSEFSKLSTIQEASGNVIAKEMIKNLLQDHLTLIHTCKQVQECADGVEDAVTSDLMTERIEQHEKNAWMLRSLIEE